MNVTLRSLVRSAYGVLDYQIVGGPNWINADRFDIVAKAEGNPPTSLFRDQSRMMLRALLADRFRLTLHREPRDLPIYALVIARRDGKLGRQLRPSNAECIAAAQRPLPAPADPNAPPPCGAGFSRFGYIAARATAFSMLLNSLSDRVDRVIVDQTALTGPFDWDLRWTPEELPPRAPGTAAGHPVRMNGVDIDPNGPLLFTAIQEQLGLKLESRRGPVEVLVIDTVERPSPD